MVLAIGCNQAEKLTIVFFTDIHVEPGNEHEHVFFQAIDEVNNSAQCDFVVITGDLSNMGSDEELLTVKSALDKLEKPYYILPGNHETNWSETGGATYQTLFGDDRFYFSTDDYQFVGFNTGPYMKMGDGHVKRDDVLWLEKILGEASRKKHLVSMAHYPLMDGLDNWTEITQQLKKYNVKMALCGHGHRLKMLNFNGISGVMGRPLIGHEKGDYGYNVIEMQGDSVWVKSKQLGQEPQLALNWNINEVSQIDTLPRPQPIDYSLNEKYQANKPDVLIEVPSSIMGGVNYQNDYLYWLASNGTLSCFDAEDRKVMWEQNLGKPQYATPVVCQDLVITGTSQGFIKAFNNKSGELVWETDVKYPVFSEGKIDGDNLYITSGKGGMISLKAATGEVNWHYQGVKGFAQSTPNVTDDKVIFGAWDTFLHCLNKNTGDVVWKWTNGHRATLYSPANVHPFVSNNKVFIVAPDRCMTVIDLETGKQVFRTNEHKVRESSGMSADGKYFFAKLMNDSIVAYPTNGFDVNKEWSVNVGFGYEHNPVPLIATADVVYGGTKNGEVFAVDIAARELLWRYKITNSSINKLQFINEGRLLVNTMDGKIVLFKI